MSTLLEDTDYCVKQYRCDLSIYLMTVLSTSYATIMYLEINSPSNGNIVFDGLNAIVKT